MIFSVIIPTYNRRAFLEQALESVWAQRFTDFEVIVVDDGSTDDTLAMLRDQQRLHPSLRSIPQDNAGPGAARNRGGRVAAGKYLAFLDSDDLWLPWTLDVFASVITSYDEPAVIGGNFIEVADGVASGEVSESTLQVVAFHDYFASWRHSLYVGAGMGVFRRDYFLQSSGFLEDRLNAEDHDLMMRLGACPGYVKILSPVTLTYRRHECSETADFSKALAGTLRLIELEGRGVYAGGMAKARQRQAILAARIRPVAVGCLVRGLIHSGWRLYVQSFMWQVRAMRLRFLVGFAFLALYRWMRGVADRVAA